jgi:ribose transport system substrate-binding protein
MGNDGAQFGARYVGHEEGADIVVEYLAPRTLDPKLQSDLIRQAIDSKKDGLLVSCIDSSISEPIDEAVAAGIPVITYDSDCPESERLGFYSMVSEDTGRRGADLLASAMGPGPKTVAILTGRAGADNLERRASAFEARLADEYPDIEIVETIHCTETAESCGEGIEEGIIEKYPDLDGLFVVGLWGLLDACTCSDSGMTCKCEDDQMPKWKAAASNGLKTVAYDSLPFELELLEQGYVSALLGQKYFGWGYDTVRMMYDHLTNDAEVGEFIDSGFDVVCANNVSDMQVKWQAADFSTPLDSDCEFE